MSDEVLEAEVVEEDGSERLPVRRPEYEPQGGLDVQSLMDKAVSSGDETSVAVLERLMDLRDREADRQAQQALMQALWRFRERCPPIPKTAVAGTRVDRHTGVESEVRYAKLEAIQSIIDPILKEEGLFYRWTNPERPGGLTTRCIVMHESGATIESEMSSDIGHIPNASTAQKAAGTRTTLKRLTLGDALGLALEDDDDAEGEGISETQLDELRSMVARKSIKNPGRFWKFVGVKDETELHLVPAAAVEMVKRALGNFPDREDA